VELLSDRDLHALLFGDVSVRAVQAVGTRPEGRAQRVDSSHGVHRRPYASRLSLRPLPSGPSPRLRSGGANLQTRSVLAVPPGFNGFLRRGPTEVGPSTACGFVAPRSRPWGSPGFKSAVASRPLDPKVFGLSPLANDPSKRSSSPAAFDQRVTAEGHPFGQPRVHRVAFLLVVGATPRSCCHARTLPRPQGLVPPESSRRAPNIAAVHPPDAPMGFMAIRSDACRAPWRWRTGLAGLVPPFAWRYHPASGVPTSPRGRGKATVFSDSSGSEVAEAGDPPKRRPAEPDRVQPEGCGVLVLPTLRRAPGSVLAFREDPEGFPLPPRTQVPEVIDPERPNPKTVVRQRTFPRDFHCAGPFHPKVLGPRHGHDETPKSLTAPGAPASRRTRAPGVELCRDARYLEGGRGATDSTPTGSVPEGTSLSARHPTAPLGRLVEPVHLPKETHGRAGHRRKAVGSCSWLRLTPASWVAGLRPD